MSLLDYFFPFHLQFQFLIVKPGKGQNVEYQNVESQKLIENLAIHHFVESVN